MKPTHLLMDELNYELRIRGIVTERKDQSVKRKLLAKQLEKDCRRSTIEYADPLYNFQDEVEIINRTLDSIRSLIEEFEGPDTDSAYKRICSRIVHITGRVKRIVVSGDDADGHAATFKNESYATCLELEVLLQEKVRNGDSLMDVSSNVPALVPPTVHNVVQTVNKSVPIYKWGLKFSGEPEEDLLDFLERIDELCASRNVSRKTLFESAVELFAGNALLWFRSVRNTVHDWDSLVALLKREFLPSDYADQLWDAIRARFQQRGETVQVFVAQMENLFLRLNDFVAESTKLKYIKKNLLPHYITQLALTPVNNIADLVHFCRKIDEAHELKSRRKSNVSALVGGSVSRRPNFEARGHPPNGSDKPVNGGSRQPRKAGTVAVCETSSPSAAPKTFRCWNCQ